ncbi:ribonuclease E/G [Jeotgalibacillus marinus]|uniref:Ribonuclease E/G n=1 Tax=Jeotgalibacillus marinus TaxID=86667 RepID=A0ABV3PZP8_9BACL
MEKIMIINAREREKRWLFSEGNKVQRLEVHQPTDQSKVGNIYSGVVESIKPSLNAAFVSFDKGKNGYLSLNEVPGSKYEMGIGSFLHQGQRIMVQVKKDESRTKGAVLTANIECTATNFVFFPYGEIVTVSKKIDEVAKRDELKSWATHKLIDREGIIIRTEAKSCSTDQLEYELNELRSTFSAWEKKFSSQTKSTFPIIERSSFMVSVEQLLEKESGKIVVDDPDTKSEIDQFLSRRKDLMWDCELILNDQNIFDFHQFWNAEEKAMKKVVWMDGGISIVIEATEALTVIDVNSGKQANQGDARQSIRTINERAATEILHQLKLRDISGIIVIDFINMEFLDDRNHIEKIIKKRVVKDHKHVEVIGFTALSLFQLTRKKTRPSLDESLSIRCPVCDGKGIVLSPESMAYRLERELFEKRRSIEEVVHVQATKNVIRLFKGEEGSFGEMLEQSLGFKIEWTIVDHTHPYYAIHHLA